MAKFKDTIITNLGMEVTASLISGDLKANFQHVYTSTQDLTGLTNDDIKGLTTLSGQKQTVDAAKTAVDNAKYQVNLGAVFTNKSVGEDYDILCIGWTCLNANGDEILFAVTPLASPEIMPADDGTGNSFFTIYPQLTVAVSDTGKVEATIKEGGTISQAQFDAGLALKADDSTVVHKTDDLGGRNLLSNSDFSNGFTGYTLHNINSVNTVTLETDTDGTIMAHIHAGDTSGVGFYSNTPNNSNDPLQVGDEWTLAGLFKGTGHISYFGMENSGSDNSLQKDISTTSWQKVYKSGTKVKDGGACVFYVTSGDIYVKLLDLEHGTHVNSWNQNPSDLVTKKDGTALLNQANVYADATIKSKTLGFQKQAIFKDGSYFYTAYSGADYDEMSWAKFLMSDEVPIGLSVIRMGPKMKSNLGTSLETLNFIVEKESASWIFLISIALGAVIISGSVSNGTWTGFKELDSNKIDYNFMGEIPAGYDWNNLTNGVWIFKDAKNKDFLNAPNFMSVHSLWGTVQVNNRGSAVIQHIYSNEELEFKREYSGSPGSWSRWSGSNGTMELVTNPDLNNFLNPGTYYVNGTNIVNNPYNSAAWGQLRVSYGVDQNNTIFVLQEFIHNETVSTYRRTLAGYRGTWTAWIKS